MKYWKNRLTIIAMFVFPMAIYYWMKSAKPNILKLQVIGEKYYDEQLKDTIYHTVPDFTFTDQEGKAVTSKYLDSGVTVVNFFFTTCKDVCPIMNGNLLNIYEKSVENPRIHFLSHTVDPEEDNVMQLKKYASNLRVESYKWKFVTGDKKDIYNIAMKGYLLPAGDDVNLPPDSVKFFHSQQMLLIDNHHRIRGVYDGLKSYDIKRLDDEMKVLLYEVIHENDK